MTNSRLACMSLASFCRSLQEWESVDENMEVQAIHQIFVDNKRRYGYRRVSAEIIDRY